MSDNDSDKVCIHHGCSNNVIVVTTRCGRVASGDKCQEHIHHDPNVRDDIMKHAKSGNLICLKNEGCRIPDHDPNEKQCVLP